MSHKLRSGAIIIIIIIIIIIRNGAKIISSQTGNLIIITNGAKTKSLQTSFGDLIKSPNFVWGLNNNNKKLSKSNMSHKLRLGAIIRILIVKKKRRIAIHHPTTCCRGDVIIRNGTKTLSLRTSFEDLIIIIIKRNGAKTISLQSSFGDLIIIRNRAKVVCLTNYVWGP